MEENFSDKSWNCEIVGVLRELDMTETEWNAVGSRPGEVHSVTICGNWFFLLKGIEMAHYKNRAGKYWSLETFMLLQQLFLLWDDVILQCICIPKFSNATGIFFFFETWEWKEYLCSIVLILYLLIWDIRCFQMDDIFQMKFSDGDTQKCLLQRCFSLFPTVKN